MIPYRLNVGASIMFGSRRNEAGESSTVLVQAAPAKTDLPTLEAVYADET
jgi:hypothetical protein